MCGSVLRDAPLTLLASGFRRNDVVTQIPPSRSVRGLGGCPSRLSQEVWIAEAFPARTPLRRAKTA